MALKIALLGDICMTGKFDLKTTPEAVKQFAQIKSTLLDYDLVLANLESPFTELTSSRVCKAIHIKSPPVNTQLLRYLGVNAVSLANNHIFDYGYQGYRSTQSALNTAEIIHFGTQGQHVLLEKNQERLLLGGFCCLSAHPSKAGQKGVNILTYSNVKQFLESACVQNAFPIASIHWGKENTHYPSEDHVWFARLMATEHNYLLHGHHPHVIQGLERYRDSLIAYSLGNFCTDEHTSWSISNMTVKHAVENQQSYVLGVTIENGKILQYDVIPIMDIGDCLMVQGREAQNTIETYSALLETTPYRRSRRASVIAVPRDPNVPARFSLIWFMRRLNYHFVGAFLKGLCNSIRYQIYFSAIRQKAVEKRIC